MPNWVEFVSSRLEAPIAAIDAVSRHALGTSRVWRVTTEAGDQFAVKQYVYRSPQTRAGKDAFETEWAALTTLREMGASATTPVFADDDAGMIVTEWITGATLDDLAQRDPEAVRRSAPDALDALGYIERAFEARIAEIEPYAFEQDYDAYLGADFTAIFAEARRGYVELCDGLNVGDALSRRDQELAWQAVLNVIQSSQPTMGTLDYNARNVIVAPSRVAYLDFSTVGWDWPERRVVQYLTALGAHDPNGAFVSALTRETLTAGRDSLFFDPHALEAHYFVFACLIAERLLRGGSTPPANIEDRQRPYWENRRARFDQALEMLGYGALTDFPATNRLREQVAFQGGNR